MKSSLLSILLVLLLSGLSSITTFTFAAADARVIFYRNQSSVEKGSLFDINQNPCRHGSVLDHRGRCRTIA